jgi:hypothetical protein
MSNRCGCSTTHDSQPHAGARCVTRWYAMILTTDDLTLTRISQQSSARNTIC